MDGGHLLVDANVAELTVDEQQAGRRCGEERLEEGTILGRSIVVTLKNALSEHVGFDVGEGAGPSFNRAITGDNG